jgi:hypothetical protein
MKVVLVGQQFPGPENFLTGIQEFLSEIQMPELEFVFYDWTERFQWVLDHDGEYFHD